MARAETFYFGTIKKVIAAFGILFKDVTYETDWGEIITVPIHYAPREKFIVITQVSGDHDDGYETMVNLPRFGFELTSINFDPSRMLNPMSRMQNINGSGRNYMYNRVPYNFSFALYLATRKFEDSLKIVEQIVPFFTPDLNITIKDKPDFEFNTDIPITLNDFNLSIDWEGTFETRRTITWQFTFTAKAFLYSNVREQNRIKEAIVKMDTENFDKTYESFISYVDPRTAERVDNHEIIEQIIHGAPTVHLSINFGAGETLNLNDMAQGVPYTTFRIHPMATGEYLHVTEIGNDEPVIIYVDRLRTGENLNLTVLDSVELPFPCFYPDMVGINQLFETDLDVVTCFVSGDINGSQLFIPDIY